MIPSRRVHGESAELIVYRHITYVFVHSGKFIALHPTGNVFSFKFQSKNKAISQGKEDGKQFPTTERKSNLIAGCLLTQYQLFR